MREKEKAAAERKAAHEKQTAELVNVIREHLSHIEETRMNGDKHRIAVLGRTRSALVPVAEALRAASIPYSAVELEELKERPEVQDALALARALLNVQDRVAWLGVLRAPWCGLSLEDLHTLASAGEAELLKRPVPDLLVERQALLSEEGQRAVGRVLRAADAAQSLRFAQPAASPGTWIEQVWLRLGGAQCVDASGRANLDLFWRALDGLPEGEPDLLGPALDAALEKLTALPDPASDLERGVQLMTIHKSKGLEFEAVLVPDLQAGAGRGGAKLLSWLERGLAEPDDSGEPTEFLVAPLPSKGEDRGKAKRWVDRVYRDRERQEMRRILYVAATRAREELHLFARPAYKIEQDGSRALAEPRESLLATAWPAFEAEVRERFEVWSTRAQEPATIESIAAAGADALRVMPAPERGTLLRRLPADFLIAQGASATASIDTAILGRGQLYERHEGGVLSRALGTAVHALFEELAQLLANNGWDQARAGLAQFEPRLAAHVRAVGVERAEAGRIAAKAIELALAASRDPAGQWILSPHVDAASEIRWAGVVTGSLRTVQVDRVFRAGAEPQAQGGDVWWVIDYKTAHEENADSAALSQMRKIFAPQVELYAQVLRNLHGPDTVVYVGLYYPRMLKFDWWEA
jgi:ATP-dependent exoDNAse (exonuclease V) beta subunit